VGVVLAKRLGLTLLLLVTSLTLFGAWWGGYRVSFDGLVSNSYSPGEYLNLELTVRPFYRGPALHGGLMMRPSEATNATIGLSIPLFRWIGHPLTSLFRRTSAYSLSLEAALLFDLEIPALTAARFTVEPLLFDFSDKQIAVLGLHLLYDFASEKWGWGIRLFEITHYLF